MHLSFRVSLIRVSCYDFFGDAQFTYHKTKAQTGEIVCPKPCSKCQADLWIGRPDFQIPGSITLHFPHAVSTLLEKLVLLNASPNSAPNGHLHLKQGSHTTSALVPFLRIGNDEADGLSQKINCLHYAFPSIFFSLYQHKRAF